MNTTDTDAAGGSPGGRPAVATTPEQLERSIRVIRAAIAFSVVAIVVMVAVFVGFLDAPAVPLVPLAAFVVIADFVMLHQFTKQRRKAIEELDEERGGTPPGR